MRRKIKNGRRPSKRRPKRFRAHERENTSLYAIQILERVIKVFLQVRYGMRTAALDAIEEIAAEDVGFAFHRIDHARLRLVGVVARAGKRVDKEVLFRKALRSHRRGKRLDHLARRGNGVRSRRIPMGSDEVGYNGWSGWL